MTRREAAERIRLGDIPVRVTAAGYIYPVSPDGSAGPAEEIQRAGSEGGIVRAVLAFAAAAFLLGVAVIAMWAWL